MGGGGGAREEGQQFEFELTNGVKLLTDVHFCSMEEFHTAGLIKNIYFIMLNRSASRYPSKVAAAANYT